MKCEREIKLKMVHREKDHVDDVDVGVDLFSTVPLSIATAFIKLVICSNIKDSVENKWKQNDDDDGKANVSSLNSGTLFSLHFVINVSSPLNK